MPWQPLSRIGSSIPCSRRSATAPGETSWPAQCGRGHVKELAEPYAMSMQAVSQHIRGTGAVRADQPGTTSADPAVSARTRGARGCALMDRGEPAHVVGPKWIGWRRTLPACRRVRTSERRRAHLPGVFPAPRELVWRCLTEPAELAQFWGPERHGHADRRHRCRAPPRWTVRDPDARRARQPPDGRTFTEVVPPERLAWVESATGMHTTSTLNDRGDGSTEVVIHQRNVPEPMRLPRPAPASSPPSTSSSSTSLTSTQGDRS